jgi:ketosteroid isomerase-like protein
MKAEIDHLWRLAMSSVEQIRKVLEAFYKSYAAAFNSKDVSAISECFACPCALITGHGLNQCATESELQQLLERYLADLTERGWTRSEVGQIKIWPMAEDLAMVLADGTRHKADGSMLEPVRSCYTVRRTRRIGRLSRSRKSSRRFLAPAISPGSQHTVVIPAQ